MVEGNIAREFVVQFVVEIFRQEGRGLAKRKAADEQQKGNKFYSHEEARSISGELTTFSVAALPLRHRAYSFCAGSAVTNILSSSRLVYQSMKPVLYGALTPLA